MIIKLMRHGESLANTGEIHPTAGGDFATPLSAEGVEQSRAAAAHLDEAFVRRALIYVSPYLRAKQTLTNVLDACGLNENEIPVREDPRLREVDIGYDELEDQRELRETHGWFYYRFQHGESPADCYDRVSDFLGTMYRETQRKHRDRIFIVTHGMTLRCFVMRFLHLTVDEYNNLENPHNCDIVTISDEVNDPIPDARRIRGWTVTGLRYRG